MEESLKTKKHIVNTYYHQNYCDCGGKLQKGAIALLTDPIKIEHICEDCGAKESLLENDSNGVKFNVDFSLTI